MEPESSLPSSQVPVTSSYPETTPSSPHNPLPLPEDPSILVTQHDLFYQFQVHMFKKREYCCLMPVALINTVTWNGMSFWLVKYTRIFSKTMANFYQFSQCHTQKPVFFKFGMYIYSDNKCAVLMRTGAWRWRNWTVNCACNSAIV